MTTIRPCGGPGAWRGADLVDTSDFVHVLDDDMIAALVDLARRERDHEARSDTAFGRDPDLRRWRELAATVGRELLGGRGFSVLRGLPADELADVDNEALCSTIGRSLGVPIRQNARGDMMIRVRDEGKDFDTKGVRSFETAAQLEYHSDSSDVVGLYCVKAARSGGISTIVSSVAVHDAMVDERPDLAALLYEPWATVSVIDQTVQWKPICATNDVGDVFTRYGRLYLETATDYDTTVPMLRPEQLETLDLYDSFLRDPRFALDMRFRPGDLQLLNNYRIMHSRTAYEDWPEPERRRELLRVWLVVPDMVVPPVFEDSGFVPRTEALG
jgi:hypothetical protein